MDNATKDNRITHVFNISVIEDGMPVTCEVTVSYTVNGGGADNGGTGNKKRKDIS